MEVRSLRKDLENFLAKRGLLRKWNKAKSLFEQNIRHPSLNVELMEPRQHGVYSFRLDKQYRALFFITQGEAEVFKITKHYKKG